MKKKMIFLTMVAGLTLVVGNNASAAEKSVVTAGEKDIIAVAETAAGNHLSPNHTIQANNYMKTVDISDEDAAIIVNDIKEIVSLVKSTGVNTSTVTTLDSLLKLLPVDVAERVAVLAAEIDKLTPGFTLEQLLAEEWLTNGDKGTVLANTGTNNISSIVTIGSLLMVAAGAVVVLRRKEHQI